MKKLITLLVLVGLMLGVLVAPSTAAAQSAPDLSGLAAYFPADIPLYIGLRTDDGFVDELNTLLHSVAAQVPGAGMVPDLHSALNDAVRQGLGAGADFDSAIRPWLGDSAALGVLSLDSAVQGNTNDVPVLFAASITDRTAAETFIEMLIADKSLPLVKTTEHDMTVFSFGMATPEPDATATEEAMDSSSMSDMGASFPAIAVTDDAVLIGKTKADLPLSGDFLSLDKSDKFDVVGTLPADGYDAIVYANLGKTFQTVFGALVAQMRSSGTDTAMFESLLPIYANYPTQALGFTIFDSRALTLDIAQGPFDYSVLEGTPLANLDVKSLLNAPAVDPAFAKVIPADAPLSIQGTNLGNTVNYLIDAVGFGVQYGMQAAEMYGNRDMSKLPRFLKDITPDDIRAFVDLSFAGFTGLNLQDDVLAHINGNSALYGRFVPVSSDSMTLDTAVVTEADDAAAVQNIFDKLKVALDRYKANYTAEGDNLVLPDVIRGFFPQTFTDEKLANPAYDFVIGHKDQLIAVGSRGAVEFSLDGTGDSLADDPSYQAAQKYFLDGAQSIWYVGGASVSKLVDQVATMMPDDGRMGYQLQQGQMVLGLIDSVSLTWAMNDQGSVVRMVLALNTAPVATTTATAEVTVEPAMEVMPAVTVEATAEATP